MIDRRLIMALTAALFALMGTFAASETTKTQDREGGIIGTGIVGTVTELGSIFVNGQRIMFEPDTMVASVLGGQKAADLTPGDTVVVVAHEMSQDWRAASIEQHFALVGPLVRNQGGVTILGTSVDLSGASAQVRQLALDLSDGDWVAVSGLWKEEVLMASKLIRADDQSNAVLSGSYVPDASQTGFTIGGSSVSGFDLEHVEMGQIVTVTGAALPNGIAAQTVRIGLFSGTMSRIIAQGYMSQPTPGGLYTVLGSGAVSFTDQPQMIDTQTVGVYCISLTSEIGEYAVMTPGPASCE